MHRLSVAVPSRSYLQRKLLAVPLHSMKQGEVPNYGSTLAVAEVKYAFEYYDTG